MSYPTWRVDSWYDGNTFMGFRVVKGAKPDCIVASNGSFPVIPGDAMDKVAMRNAAISLRDKLTNEESDPRILAAECRSILFDMLKTSTPSKPTEISVPSILTIWLKERIDKLCTALRVSKDEA